MKDHYGTLGIPKNSTPDEIRSAYRNKAKEFQKEGGFGVQGRATQEWLDIMEAHQTLSKPELKSRYDAELEHPSQEPEGASPASAEGTRSRYTTNVVFHPDEEEAASVMRGVFRKYMNIDIDDISDEQGGLGGEFWRVSYHFGKNAGQPFFSRKYEVRTGRDSWQDIDNSNDGKFKTAQEWRDFLENGLFKSVSMENGRYPGDWFDTETAADRLADFQGSDRWKEYRTWFEGVWPETSETNKVPFRTFWVDGDDFDRSRREYEENRNSIPNAPENPHVRQARTSAEGRIQFGEMEDDAPRIVWGEPTDERIVWGEERPEPRIVFGQEQQTPRPNIVWGEQRQEPKPRIVFGDEEPGRVS